MNKSLRKILFVGLLLPVAVFAYSNPGTPKGFVNDFAGVFSAEQRAGLESKLNAFENATTNEIAVVTIKNLGDDTVENYAVELFKEWGIGKKGRDNGILLLVALEDRKMRIEVGYGLEGALTDAQSNGIIRNTLTPAFKANDYFGGVDEAVNQMINAVSLEYASGAGVEAEPIRENSNNFSSWNFSDFFFLVLFVPLWLASILGRSKSWWAGGVVGGVIGVVIGFIFGFVYFGITALILLIPAGLLFDFLVSSAYARNVGKGLPMPWWIGGGRGGGLGGGGFGGFGGGGSGGGGSSGSW